MDISAMSEKDIKNLISHVNFLEKFIKDMCENLCHDKNMCQNCTVKPVVDSCGKYE